MTKDQIKKIKLGQIPQVVAIFRRIPSIVGGIDKLDNEKIIEMLPELIESALPELAKLIALVTDLKEEEVLDLSLDEFTQIVVWSLEVNNTSEIISNVKKVAGLRAVQSLN